MPRGELSRLDGGKFRAYTIETGAWFFVEFTVLEGYEELTKELTCPITVIGDGFLDGFLERNQQIVCVQVTAAEVSLNLKGILPLHGLDPTLDVKKVGR